MFAELDDFLQELDEDVEGMQSTILFLQQELKLAKDAITELEKELHMLKSTLDVGGEKLLVNGSNINVSDKLTTNSCNYNRTYNNSNNNDDIVRTTNNNNSIKNNTYSCNSNNPINLSSHSNYYNGGESTVIVGGSNNKDFKINGDNHNEQIMLINMSNKKINSNSNVKQNNKIKRNYDSDSSECSNDNVVINLEMHNKKLKKKKVRRSSSVLSINLNDDDNLVDIVDGVEKSGTSVITAAGVAGLAMSSVPTPTKINNNIITKQTISILATCTSPINGNSKVMEG